MKYFQQRNRLQYKHIYVYSLYNLHKILSLLIDNIRKQRLILFTRPSCTGRFVKVMVLTSYMKRSISTRILTRQGLQ